MDEITRLANAVAGVRPAMEKIAIITKAAIQNSVDNGFYAQVLEDLEAVDEAEYETIGRQPGAMFKKLLPPEAYTIAKTKTPFAKDMPAGSETFRMEPWLNSNDSAGKIVENSWIRFLAPKQRPDLIGPLMITHVQNPDPNPGNFDATITWKNQSVQQIEGRDIIVANYEVTITPDDTPIIVAEFDLLLGLNSIRESGHWQADTRGAVLVNVTYINEEQGYQPNPETDPTWYTKWPWVIDRFTFEITWSPYTESWVEDKTTFTFEDTVGLMDSFVMHSAMVIEPLEGADIVEGTAELKIDRASNVCKMNLYPADEAIQSASGDFAVVHYILWGLGAIALPFKANWNGNSFDVTFTYADISLLDAIEKIGGSEGVPTGDVMVNARNLILSMVLNSMTPTAMIKTEVTA